MPAFIEIMLMGNDYSMDKQVSGYQHGPTDSRYSKLTLVEESTFVIIA